MAYELKPSDELIAREKKEAEEKEKYGDKAWNPEQELPVYKDMGAVMNTGKTIMSTQKKLGIVYKIVGVLILAAAIFGIVKAVQYMIGSGGKDISGYLRMSEGELGDMLGITFEQHNEYAKGIQQYSGGEVTVREGKGLEVVYIDGRQVGICTSDRDYRFFGVGINDADKDVQELLKYKSEGSFVVLNDLQGGNSTSYYYYNRAENSCLVITINSKSNRVVYMSYFTELALVTKELSGF